MSVHVVRGFSAAVVAFLAAQSAHADVTAQDVWGELRAYFTNSGYELSANENMSGNTLSVTDMVMAMQVTPEAGGVQLEISQMTLTENGDGTVSIQFPPEIPIDFSIQAEDGSTGAGRIVYTLTGTEIVASGTTDDLVFSTAAEAIGFRMDDLSVEGSPEASDAVEMTLSLANVSGETRVVKGAVRDYTQQMTAETMSYLLTVNAPGQDGPPENARFEGTLSGLTFNGSGSMPEVANPADVAAMLRDGLKADMAFSYTSGLGSVVGTGPDGDFAMQSSSQGGGMTLEMNVDKLAVAATQTGSAITLQTADIPFPVTMQMAEVSYAMDMPVSKSDAEQPFALTITLGNFAIADQLWGMIDPAGALPHDPANVVLDLTGSGKLFHDLFDPVAISEAELSRAAPGEVNSVQVKNLLVSVAGAELTGNGDFTFDNSKAAENEGMPVPAGTANLKLIGANGLIDKLIQMGLLQEDEAMGARMMMGMMAVPGDGEDTLLSTIEMNDKGQVFANGQRLK